MNRKVSIIIKIFIWFYRLIGLTFGGLVISSNEKLVSNKLLKRYGILTFILLSILNFYGLKNSKWLKIRFYDFIFNDSSHYDFENISHFPKLFVFKSEWNRVFYALKNIEINTNQRILFAL